MAVHTPGDIQRALGMLPTGQYILTSAFEQKRAGVVAHSAQACGDAPPLICVACRKGQPIGPIIRDSRRFGLCHVSGLEKALARRFAFQNAERGDPFELVETDRLVSACPLLKLASIVLDCEVFRRVDLECECELYIGLVHAALVRGGAA